ncbi:copper resistance protein CopC [Actinoplanes sp. ATCC 53533]|uniref:copper resistance CopC family protein n=1 Tax=Actinoplanes sp. ATCC 53533 TaxID=1288362 RepID=UPI000F7AC83F|nr:copper resistance CopC family protein [Actinoplanes sp. ATCC 53533]RSM58404.1 copper resistance protein CopC [Actinoplanes sp. ATCC 53533]
MRRLLLVLAAVCVVLLPAGPALAHNQLVSAKPDRNAVLRKAPTAVTLAFLQRLNPDFTTIVVSDAAKRPIPASAPTIKAKSATVTLDQALGNGAYQVAYRVVSVDGHTVQGKYTFTVADPSAPAADAAPSAAASAPEAAPPASASAPTVAVAPAAGSGGAADGMPIALIGLGVVLAAGAGYLYVSRRRRAVAART